MDLRQILYGEITFVPAKCSTSNNSSSLHNQQPQILEEFQAPRYQLCDPNLIELSWMKSESVGGGLVNVGNTCFLNSVLQCLTYCPPLYNFLIRHNGGHSQSCKINQFCMLCEMEKIVKRIKSSAGGSFKPNSIVQRLKYINKSFQYGRQEDAHEFLRYIIDHMWKACLMNIDSNINNNNNCNGNSHGNGSTNGNSLTHVGKLDPRIKETTYINHIFGGYHRSQVLCLSCNSRSNTFDFFMDLILDIRNAKSLEEALKRFTQPETLQNENAYKCGKCRKKVAARKKFTVYKAPNVATFQLKRFDSDRIFGGKFTKFISYPMELDLRPYMSDPTKPPIKYLLSAVLVHVGHSSNSGHYFCFIRNSNNFWYRMDDSNVSLVNQSVVLQQQAYVLFYTRKTSDLKHSSNSVAQGLNKSITATKTPMMMTNSVNNRSYNGNGNNNINLNGKSNNTTHDASNNNNSLPRNSNGETPSNSASAPKNMNITSNNGNNNYHCPNNTNNNNNVNNANYLRKQSLSLATWHGSRSKLDDEDLNHRKLNETTERDKHNEELDIGKMKKIKSHARNERFLYISKSRPFQRYTSHGHQQYKRRRF